QRCALGTVGRCYALRSLCRSMGGCALARAPLVRDFDQLDNSPSNYRAIHYAGSDHFQLHRAMALRREHWRLADCIDRIRSFLDLALGTGWSSTVDSAHGLPVSDGSSCAEIGVSHL